MTYYDKLNKIEEAQDLLKQAVELIKDAVKNTHEENSAKSYIISHLEIMIDSDHSYYSSSPTLDDIYKNLNDEKEENEFSAGEDFDEAEEAEWRNKIYN
jgi:aspartyl/asparaginyl-tRNA synthetase